MQAISIYTRKEAIEDGFLVDVTETAKEANIKFPVCVTQAVWADIENIPESKKPFQNIGGRLWDVLYMLYTKIKYGDIDGDTLRYRIIMHVSNATYYDLKAVVHGGDNGEPVITVMRPWED